VKLHVDTDPSATQPDVTAALTLVLPKQIVVNAQMMNGAPAGQKVWMILNSKPGAPQTITNRVVPGTVSAAADPYGLAVRFEVPGDLQTFVGQAVAFTDVSLTIEAGSPDHSYLQMTDCSAPLPVKAVATFVTTDHANAWDLADEHSVSCQ
jgi:hypothetical protein